MPRIRLERSNTLRPDPGSRRPPVERLGERMGVFFPVLALTGCALAMDAPTSPPVTGSRSAGPTSAPQIGGPVTSGTVSLSVIEALPGDLREVLEEQRKRYGAPL